MKSKGHNVIFDDNKSELKIERILSSRRILQQKVLKDGYDYLFFLDTDLMIPSKTLKKLVEADKDIIVGVYLATMKVGGKAGVFPVLYDFADKGKARLMLHQEVIDDKVIEINASGLGCCLISKKVLEKINFRYFKESKSGEDVAFFVDAREKFGFKAFANTSVKCLHMVYPPGDIRNNKFKFKKVAVSYSFGVD